MAVTYPVIPTEDIFVPAHASDADPLPVGNLPAAGTSSEWSRADHVHVGGQGGGNTFSQLIKDENGVAVANPDSDAVVIALDKNKEGIRQLPYNVATVLSFDLPRPYRRGAVTLTPSSNDSIAYTTNYPPSKRTSVAPGVASKLIYVTDNANECKRLTSLVQNDTSESTWTELGADDVYGKTKVTMKDKDGNPGQNAIERGYEAAQSSNFQGGSFSQGQYYDNGSTDSSSNAIRYGYSSFYYSSSYSGIKVKLPKIDGIDTYVMFRFYSGTPSAANYLGSVTLYDGQSYDVSGVMSSGSLYYTMTVYKVNGNSIDVGSLPSTFRMVFFYALPTSGEIPLYSALMSGSLGAPAFLYIVQALWIDVPSQTLKIALIGKNTRGDTYISEGGQWQYINFFGDPNSIQ